MSARGLLLAWAAVVVLAGISTVTIAAASDAFGPQRHTASSCLVPSLPGAVVTVRLIDMRAMMGDSHAMMRQLDWRRFGHGMMVVTAAPASVAAGTVSLRVDNAGYLRHEIVVLPLAAGQAAGARTPADDGTVDETGSVGEASAECAAGAGDGIAPGSSGWVTLTLAAGRYELACNLPGHYLAGMHTELDVR